MSPTSTLPRMYRMRCWRKLHLLEPTTTTLTPHPLPRQIFHLPRLLAASPVDSSPSALASTEINVFSHMEFLESPDRLEYPVLSSKRQFKDQHRHSIRLRSSRTKAMECRSITLSRCRRTGTSTEDTSNSLHLNKATTPFLPISSTTLSNTSRVLPCSSNTISRFLSITFPNKCTRKFPSRLYLPLV